MRDLSKNISCTVRYYLLSLSLLTVFLFRRVFVAAASFLIGSEAAMKRARVSERVTVSNNIIPILI